MSDKLLTYSNKAKRITLYIRTNNIIQYTHCSRVLPYPHAHTLLYKVKNTKGEYTQSTTTNAY